MHTDKMLFIGVTGGVGAGKSEILNYLRSCYNSRVMLTDEIAHDLMEPGTGCYCTLQQIFLGKDVYQSAGGPFDRPKLAKLLFEQPALRRSLNQIVHPAVKQYVKQQEEKERREGKIDLLIVEAALLIEEHYDEICDELWYIFTSEPNRAARLRASRGYSDEKIRSIFQAQLTEEEFRRYCKIEIDNNGSVWQSFDQIDRVLGSYQIPKIADYPN